LKSIFDKIMRHLIVFLGYIYDKTFE